MNLLPVPRGPAFLAKTLLQMQQNLLSHYRKETECIFPSLGVLFLPAQTAIGMSISLLP